MFPLYPPYNGNPVNAQEHFNLSPREYSASDYHSLVVASAQVKQAYCSSWYTGTEFRDYAGTVYISPPTPIIIPSEARYDGIAPMQLQPTINPPYPWEVRNATYY